ncbi:MAG: hypothetical protein JSU79_09915 [Dehalococcoidales bacterium]|nr:MAG: hypothetical protein JSU79_09915 [Dehalococcoidales bacterium]
MKNTLRISLVQMRCEKGAINENMAAAAGFIEEAEKRGVDIIGFPEASITGYNEPARYPEAVISLNGSEMAKFLKLTEGRNLTVLAGIIEENPEGLPFTTQIVARNGMLIGYHRKMYDGEDEKPWFTVGSEIEVFDHEGLTFGITICAEISKEELFVECSRRGARIMFELAAPGLYGEQATRDWKAGYEWWEGECLKSFTEYSKKYGIWIAVATQAGSTSDEDFPGGGYLFDPSGERVYSTKDWNPCVSYLKIDLDSQEVTELS